MSPDSRRVYVHLAPSRLALKSYVELEQNLIDTW